MDPFLDCKRIFSPHFWERLEHRKIPTDQIFEIVEKGIKTHLGNCKYTIKLGQWTIIAKLYRCRVIMKTVFPK